MANRDYGDIAGGGVLALTGAFITGYAMSTLSLGTVARMGPGMFPAALGVILAVLGLLIVLPALTRAAPKPEIDYRTLVAVTAGMLAFAFLLRPFGMVPAIVVLTLISSRADGKLSWTKAGIVAAALSLAAVLLFRIGLDLQIPIINWPW